MKITKTIVGNLTTYFYDGVKRYEHYKNSTTRYEWIKEYKDGKEKCVKDSDGYKRWSYDFQENTENWGEEEGVKPFEFGN